MAEKRESIRESIAVELRQIIQADRMAVDIIQRANDTRKTIEEQTEREKSTILKDAAKRRAEMAKRAEEELRAAAQQRNDSARAAFAERKKNLGAEMEQNRVAWAEEITRVILDKA